MKKYLIPKHQNPASTIEYSPYLYRDELSYRKVQDENRLNWLQQRYKYELDKYIQQHGDDFYNNPTTMTQLLVTPSKTYIDYDSREMMPRGVELSEEDRINQRLQEGQIGASAVRKATHAVAKPLMEAVLVTTGVGMPSAASLPFKVGQKVLNATFSPLSTTAKALSTVPRFSSLATKSMPVAKGLETSYWGATGIKGLYNTANEYSRGQISPGEAAIYGTLDGLMVYPLFRGVYDPLKLIGKEYKYYRMRNPKPQRAKATEIPVEREMLSLPQRKLLDFK